MKLIINIFIEEFKLTQPILEFYQRYLVITNTPNRVQESQCNMERDLRKTMNGNSQFETEMIMTDIIEQLRIQYPTCKKVLLVSEKEPRITERPELAQIFKDHPNELRNLIYYSLQPQKMDCRNNSYPFLAHNIIKTEPTVLLHCFLEPPSEQGRCLFEFLTNNPNQTARGYFYDMLNTFSNNFQDKMRNFLMQDKWSLDMCLSKSHYPEVFNFLFNIVIYSTENKGDFEARLFRALLDQVTSTTQPVMLSQNILCALQQINQNSNRLNLGVCSLIHTSFNSQFIDNILLTLTSSPSEQHCQNLLQILTEVTRMYEYFYNANQKLTIKSDIGKLQQAVARMVQSMGKICEIIKETTKGREIGFSNGENVAAVGLKRYYTLELVERVMQLPPEFVSKNFDINKGELLQSLQVYITKNPWNNMAHRLVEKIVISIIDSFESYAQIQQNYIGPNGFLRFLIQTFKNHDYMFLSSGKLSTYGYIHSLYNIAKAICVKLQKSADLRTVMMKFSPWEDFIVEDLQKYQQTLEVNLGGEALNEINSKKKEESIRKIVVDLSQQKEISITAEQNQDENQRFVEIILYSQGFRKGRSAVRKTSYTVDSPYRHYRFNNEQTKSQGKKAVQFFSHQGSPCRDDQNSSMQSQGSPTPTAIYPPADLNALFSFNVFSASQGFLEKPPQKFQMGGSEIIPKSISELSQEQRERSNSQEVTLGDLRVT